MFLAISLALASCGTKPQTIEVRSAPIERKIPKQDAPRSLSIAAPKFIVLTATNVETYREQITSGKLIVYGLDEKGYKQLLRNNAELKRYIEQQKAIIGYYEDAL